MSPASITITMVRFLWEAVHLECHSQRNTARYTHGWVKFQRLAITWRGSGSRQHSATGSFCNHPNYTEGCLSCNTAFNIHKILTWTSISSWGAWRNSETFNKTNKKRSMGHIAHLNNNYWIPFDILNMKLFKNIIKL